MRASDAAPASVVPLGLVLLALSACGTTERRDFVGEADGRCADAAREIENARRDIGPQRERSDTERFLGELVEARTELVADLRDVEPTADLNGDFERFVGVQERLRVIADRGLRALRRQDRPAFESARSRDREAQGRADELGAGLGFEECARRLSQDAREEVRDSLERSIASNDAEQMCDALSERHLEEVYGSKDSCLSEQRMIGESTGFEIEELAGVADVSADAVVRLRGGIRGGRAFRVDLAFEEGRYRIDSIEPLAAREGPAGPR